jgi:hypothetical protein
VAARLLILTDGAAAACAGPLPKLLAGWRLRLRWPRPAALATRAVVVDDVQGRQFFVCEDARPLIDLSLPAGTYHVTLRAGALQRRYTAALQDGATVELRLPPPAARS